MSKPKSGQKRFTSLQEKAVTLTQVRVTDVRGIQIAVWLFFLSLLSLLTPLSSFAQPVTPAALNQVDLVLANVIRGALALVGIVSAIVLLMGGIGYLTSGGDKEGAAKARHTITFAIIGLLVSVSAWLILNIVGTFLGVDLRNFTICFPGQTC